MSENEKPEWMDEPEANDLDDAARRREIERLTAKIIEAERNIKKNEPDEFDKKARDCCPCRYYWKEQDCGTCMPCECRPAVAAALRELAASLTRTYIAQLAAKDAENRG
jgi:hypothetical protein